jgi:hypothetical protein
VRQDGLVQRQQFVHHRLDLAAPGSREQLAAHRAQICLGDGGSAERGEGHRLLERVHDLHAEVRRRLARDSAHGHHAAVRVEPVEERRHVLAGYDVDDDVVAGRGPRSCVAGAVEQVGRTESAQPLAALG